MRINETIYAALADILGLSLFSGLQEHPLIVSFRNMLEDVTGEKLDNPIFGMSDASLDIVHDWALFTEAFLQYQQGYSFYLTVGYLTITDDNLYTRAAEAEAAPPAVLCAMAKTDLSRIGRLASFQIHSLGFHIAEILRKSGLVEIAQNIEEESRVIWAAEGKKGQAPDSERLLRLFPENSNWGSSLPGLTEYIHANGAGLLGLYTAFCWTPQEFPLISTVSASSSFSLMPDAAAEGNFGGNATVFPSRFSDALSIKPVRNPDPVRLSDLCGYEDQRSVVIDNTLRFLEMKPANNLLLYGDRGTGKSAAVKAVCNEFSARGLRLIEIRKSDLPELSDILNALASRSRRFILFIDDLSFETTDDSFRDLKALLEGGIGTRPPNVVIYATSNRRHLVKERREDRPALGLAAGGSAAEPRAFDTMQEQFSLADRFGLTVIFSAPSQEEYLRIACFIARQRGILPPSVSDAPEAVEAENRFRENAVRWERWFNGRSPRTAVQYVDWLAGGEGIDGKFPWD